MQIELPIGLLFSRTGSYGTVAHSLLNGALLACREVNENPDVGVRLLPVLSDPGGVLENYASATQAFLDQGIRHICGCYTSSSRKEVIPLIEKGDALLWYPTHYEGFESATNVIYTGAAPNHHISPLIDYLFTRCGRKAYCIGSNYIWGWESNRVLREGILRRGGTVLGERYVPVGVTALDTIIDEILRLQPDFVFNALIGESSYAFFRAFRRACRERGIDQAVRFPVASCNLSEPELYAIGAEAAAGQISSSVYFSSLTDDANRAFVARYRVAFPDGPCVSAEAEAAYVAIHLLAKSVAAAGSGDMVRVRDAAGGIGFDAPQGRVTIDATTLHAALTPRIGISRADFGFDVVVEAPAPVPADPYLVGVAPETEVAARPRVRVVS
ncbi:aliphatic amidase expression-regulating protein [Sinirhodobacter populi]|uniref:Aliphatic amidase expression-regulating protein n=1 Tax=Paenirhodobacter populi TaxID=2306993 RepID=A0A443K1N4_9RHOB|nr:transporter substrate-binding domain-containing protein [Sinirhodobacter populi]RWR26667.1 aliphatic amidase expression-regulating protein [Sinirhodobacter populi]